MNPWAVLLLCLAAAAPAELAREITAGDVAAVRTRGPSVMPQIVKAYRAADPDGRARIARLLYGLGWKSDDARDALMADVRTDHQALRLQVQWALGRVSDDPAVVDVLLANMRHDGNLLFRDKAACALASDQIHLTPAQKVRLFAGLVDALEDEKLDVRNIALLALRILTGQDKGYAPDAAVDERARAIREWRRWLDEYRASL